MAIAAESNGERAEAAALYSRAADMRGAWAREGDGEVLGALPAKASDVDMRSALSLDFGQHLADFPKFCRHFWVTKVPWGLLRISLSQLPQGWDSR